ncbi:MAG: PilZ domain-containing protein, partial [Gemmatimonadales bacterium]
MTGGAGFGPEGLERRRGPRTPVDKLSVVVSVVGARLVNISLFGLMIESPVPLEREAVLSFRLVIGAHKGDVEARVAACTLGATGQARRYGIGLEFTTLPLDVRSR